MVKLIGAYILAISCLLFFKVECQEICSKHCEASYPLHTVDKVEELQACTKGCRLEFLSFLAHHEEPCNKDCNRAYEKGTDGEKKACISGCEEQKRLDKQPKTLEVEETSDFVFQFRILHPFFSARNYYKSWFNKQHGADGKGEEESPSYFVEQTSTDANGNSVFMRVEMYPWVNVRNSAVRHQIQQQVTMETEEKSSTLKTYAGKIHGGATRWLNCVQVKAGVPYATLVAVLFLSLVMVAWICCSTCEDESDEVNEKKHSFSKHGLSIMADNLHVDEEDGSKVFTINAHNDEAGPLPEKQKLIL